MGASGAVRDQFGMALVTLEEGIGSWSAVTLQAYLISRMEGELCFRIPS